MSNDPTDESGTPTTTEDQTDEITAEDLVEEVSIDGMCGVY